MEKTNGVDNNSEKLKEKQIDVIYRLLQQQPLGLTIASLEEALNNEFVVPVNRRTLLRRLVAMKNNGQIIARGNGNHIRYFVSKSIPEPEITQSHQLSQESEKSLAYVHQLIFNRKPVGYNPDFMDSYIPGKTYYLQASLREQLKTMGQSNFQQQPKLSQQLGQEKIIGTYVRNIYHRLLVDLSWASSHLEGNTYTRLETQNLIEFGQVAVGRDLAETQMILNHKAAIEMMVENVDKIGLNAYTICTLHSNLSYNLLPNPLDSGRLRQIPVEISGTTYMPMVIPDQIQLTFYKMLEKATEIMDPYEQSFFIMVHLPYLQPFIDVNKRVSRLASNIPFIRHDLCPLSFVDVDKEVYMDGLLAIYELNSVDILKEVYMLAYERSCQRYAGIVQSMIEPDPLRLRYRDLISSVIKAVVERMEAPTAETVNRILDEHIYQSPDKNALQDMLLKEFTYIHEGNIGRYGLMPSQYYKWRAEARS
ncbi:MAG: Fic family protein [Alphaproteobacteria bacterium]